MNTRVYTIFFVLLAITISSEFAEATPPTPPPDPVPSTLIASDPQYNSSSSLGIKEHHPSADSNYISAVYQSFTSYTENRIIHQVAFMLARSGACTTTFYAKLYTHTGTYGTSSKPDQLLATSEGVPYTQMWTGIGTNNLVFFTFNESQRVTLTANTYYVIAVGFATTGDLSSLVYFNAQQDGTAHAHDGNNGFYRNSQWNTFGNDMIFYVWGY